MYSLTVFDGPPAYSFCPMGMHLGWLLRTSHVPWLDLVNFLFLRKFILTVGFYTHAIQDVRNLSHSCSLKRHKQMSFSIQERRWSVIREKKVLFTPAPVLSPALLFGLYYRRVLKKTWGNIYLYILLHRLLLKKK